jgi:hypothetical protein
MNMKQLLSKSFTSFILSAGLLLTTSTVFAQVKIGTNPTVIDPANNLEVEASTAGRKTSIDKSSGKVTIADGSQGTSKILTSDENGVATWEAPSVQDTPVFLSVNKTGTANHWEPGVH